MKTLALGPDRTLRYREIEGDPARPRLVFLHDALGCIELWEDFPEQLCRETDCPGLVFDRQGHGGSSPLTIERTVHYLHHYALDELPRLVDRVLPGRPLLLVGHSDGATIGLMYAARGDASLRGVVSVAAHVIVEKEMRPGIADAIAAFEAGKLDRLRTYHGEKTDALFHAWAHTWSSDWFASWSIEYLLPAVTCPVLAIQGRADQYATERQVDKILAGVRGPAGKLVLDDCGHAPHQDQPERVLHAVADWCRAAEIP